MQTTESASLNKSSDKSAVLFHELQLGAQLNECVKTKRAADFYLMLAMLNEDVREHSQFFVPQTKTKDRQYSDELLRKAFSLPNKAPLALQAYSQLKQASKAQLIVDQKLATLHLQEALTPMPIAFRDDKYHIPSNVLADTSIHCQQRNQQDSPQQKKNEKPQKSLNAAAFFNAKAWLDNIQNSLVNGNNIHIQTA